MSNSINSILKKDKSSIREQLLDREYKRDASRDVWIRLSDGKEFDKLPIDRLLSR